MTAKKAPAVTEESPVDSVAENPSNTALRNQLRNQAERWLIEQHRDEFDAYAEKLYTANGLSFRKRVSADERAARVAAEKEAKAKAKLEKLYAEFPNLRPVEGQVSIEELEDANA